MKCARKIAVGALPCLLMLAIALTPVGCGGSMTTTSGMSTTSTATSTAASSASTTISAQKQAAEAYFTAMASTIQKDYQCNAWLRTALGQWEQKYGETSLSTSLTGWTAVLPTFERALSEEQVILQGYKAIAPPPAFRTAHAALLLTNDKSVADFKSFIAAIKAKRPASELMSMMHAAAATSTTDAVLLADFRAAAASVGVSVPANLISVYQDNTSSGQTTS